MATSPDRVQLSSECRAELASGQNGRPVPQQSGPAGARIGHALVPLRELLRRLCTFMEEDRFGDALEGRKRGKSG